MRSRSVTHPYHSAISSSPSFSLGARDDDDDCLAPPHDIGAGALASPRVPGHLPPGAVSASDRFFVSPEPTAWLVDDAAAGKAQALRAVAELVQTFSIDPRAEFLESMAGMAAWCGAEGMPEPEDREFVEELLPATWTATSAASTATAFADLTARRQPAK